ncbi:MAG: hypothetical protein ACJ8F3_14000 [Xanthobacteraceae bacterium]
MPIRPLLDAEPGVFDPDDIQSIILAFEDALGSLRLVNREDPAVLLVAKVMIELAKAGERDPVVLRDRTLLQVSPPQA